MIDNQLHRITLATQDTTMIDHGLQNGGLFSFTLTAVFGNFGFAVSTLTRKLLHCESITKSRN